VTVDPDDLCQPRLLIETLGVVTLTPRLHPRYCGVSIEPMRKGARPASSSTGNSVEAIVRGRHSRTRFLARSRSSAVLGREPYFICTSARPFAAIPDSSSWRSSTRRHTRATTGTRRPTPRVSATSHSPSKTSPPSSPACEPAARSSSASWSAMRTATGSATSAARRESSSSWPSRSADGSGPPPTPDQLERPDSRSARGSADSSGYRHRSSAICSVGL
jgi:hypothetical protein